MDDINTTRDKDRLEIYNTIILAIATLAITWCSYQSTLWNGIQTFRLSESNKYGRLAQQKVIQSGQSKAMEEGMIIAFVNAAFDKDTSKVNFILRGVRPDMAKILTDWLQSHPFENASVPQHPMVMPGYEELMKSRLKESEDLSEKGGEAYREAQRANQNGDNYSLLDVMFGMVMFLGAITTKLARIQLRFTLTAISSIICIGCLVLILFYMPIAHKG